MKHVIKQALLLTVFFLPFFSAVSAEASEIIIVGDTQLKPVLDVVTAIEGVLQSRAAVYPPAQVNGRLRQVVSEERAKAVIALGKDAMDIAAGLPESVPVIYGMLIMPPKVQRQNITGVFMETPIDEYLALINKGFPQLRRIGAVYSRDTERLVRTLESPHIRTAKVKNSYEFVNAVKSMDIDGLLLLPDRNLMTPAALEALYLFSFKNRIPVLGISERHVKEGSLCALVFDTQGMGKQLGEMARAVLAGGSADAAPPEPPRKFNLYINMDTAKKMNLAVPDELIRRAGKVYP